MVENPEDPNELDKVYLKLTYIERRLDQLDKKYRVSWLQKRHFRRLPIFPKKR